MCYHIHKFLWLPGCYGNHTGVPNMENKQKWAISIILWTFFDITIEPNSWNVLKIIVHMSGALQSATKDAKNIGRQGNR